MSNMSDLDLCIQEVAEYDTAVHSEIVEEIDLHLNGLKSFGELSFRAQRAIEIWEAEATEEMSIHQGYIGYPGADDDDPTTEEECEN